MKLSKSYAVHDGRSDEIAFREPLFSDFMEIGEPVAQGWMADGIVVRNINYAAIQAYAERLVRQPWDAALLAQLNIKDSKAVTETILGFFRDGEGSSPMPATSSSSTADGQPTPSNG